MDNYLPYSHASLCKGVHRIAKKLLEGVNRLLPSDKTLNFNSG